MKNLKVKVCLVGSEGVGKTSLIRRYVLQQFQGEYLRTMGAMVSKKTLQVEPTPGDKVSVDIMVWDIMGRKEFVDLVGDAYFEFANGVMAVCDGTRRDTFSALASWIDGVRNMTGEIPLVILVNKTDMGQGQVREEEVRNLARRFGATYLFTSAKTGAGVEEAFRILTEAIVAAPAPA